MALARGPLMRAPVAGAPGTACLWGCGAWVPPREPVWARGGGGDSALLPGSAGNEAEQVAARALRRPGQRWARSGRAPGILTRRAEAGCVTWAGDAEGTLPVLEESR